MTITQIYQPKFGRNETITTHSSLNFGYAEPTTLSGNGGYSITRFFIGSKQYIAPTGGRLIIEAK